MRLLTIFSLLTIITTISCTRTVCDPENSSYTLQGKWKFKEYYMDPGNGSGKWQPAPQGQTYVEFKTDGTLASDLPLFSNYPKYQHTDSTITVLAPVGTNQFMIYYKIEGSTLELNPLCFEGCGFRFKRQ
jgi:hypothetical protein